MPIDNIDELRTFVQVVESGSLTAAARALGLTKNAVSRRLFRLERRTGVRLLDRNTRSMQVTDDGVSFHRRCTEIVALVDAAEDGIAAAPDRLRGTLRAAVPSQFVPILSHRLHRFLAKHPGLSVQLQVSDQPVNIVSQAVDVGVIVGAVAETSLVARRIGEASGILAARRDYLDRRGRPRHPADLASHDCLLYVDQRVQTHWTLIDSENQALVVPVRGRISSTSSVALRDGLLAGLGVGVVMRGDLDRRLGVERVLPRYRFQPLAIWAVYSPAQRQSLRVRAFLQVLEEAARALAGVPNARGARPGRDRSGRSSAPA